MDSGDKNLGEGGFSFFDDYYADCPSPCYVIMDLKYFDLLGAVVGPVLPDILVLFAMF